MRNADAVHELDTDLRTIFGRRLKSLVVHGGTGTVATPVATVAVVDALTVDDLRACAARVWNWHERGLATPLILAADEFSRSLDAFPFEFGAILADYELVSGSDPFADLAVDPADLRRACEVQARSHLLHLREAYIETHGDANAVAALVARSAPPLTALLKNVSQLAHSPVPRGVLTRVCELSPSGTISADEASRMFSEYLTDMERLVDGLDQWSAA